MMTKPAGSDPGDLQINLCRALLHWVEVACQLFIFPGGMVCQRPTLSIPVKNPTHNQKEVQSFLRFTNFYFIKGFSSITCPLFDLSKKDTPFAWMANYETAF